METYLISKRDHGRVQTMLRWFERNYRNLKPTLRRRSISAGGGGGSAAIWAVVIRGLQYADPLGTPPDGYSQYICRLIDDTTPDWNYLVEYQINYRVVASDGLIYTSRTVNTGNDPTNSPDHWSPDAEISPMPWSEDDTGANAVVDCRNFIPWFVTGKVVKLVTRVIANVTYYYFDDCMLRVKQPNDPEQSLMWNEDENRAMSVFSG